jgi:hypothetical protein
MTWNSFCTLAIGPDVMLPTVAQEVPAQLAEGALQVASLHGLDCTRIGVHCQEPLYLSHRTLGLSRAWQPPLVPRCGCQASAAGRCSARLCRGAPVLPCLSHPSRGTAVSQGEEVIRVHFLALGLCPAPLQKAPRRQPDPIAPSPLAPPSAYPRLRAYQYGSATAFCSLW